MAAYSAKEVAVILNALCRLGFIRDDIFASASDRIRTIPSTDYISEKDLGLICNAFAKAGIPDRPLFEYLAPRIVSQIPAMSSQSCGNICHAFGKLGFHGEPSTKLIPLLCERILTHKNATNQELSNVLHSMAKLEIRNSDSIESLVQLISNRIHSMMPIEIAAVATALSRLGISDRQLMSGMKKRVEKTIDKYSAYELTAVLHAFSQLDVPTPTSLFQKVNPDLFINTNPHTACIALCAFGRVGLPVSDELASRLAESVEAEQDSQYLVDVLFGLCRFENLSDRLRGLVKHVASELTVRGFPVNPVNVNQLIFAINKFGETPVQGLEALYQNALSNASKIIKSFDERQIANILFAFSSVSQKISDIERTLAVALAQRITDVKNPQLFASCVESIARLDIRAATVWNTIERRIKVVVPESPVLDVQTCQSLAHVGRFKGEITRILLKRISVEKLSASAGIALLYTTLFAGIKDIEFIESLIYHLVRRIDFMSLEQFRETNRLVHETGLTVAPFKLLDPVSSNVDRSPFVCHVSSKDAETGELDRVSAMIQEGLLKKKQQTDFSATKELSSAINDVEKIGAMPQLVEILKESLAAELSNQSLDLGTLLMILPYLAPGSHPKLAKAALSRLEEGDSVNLQSASRLLSLGYGPLRDKLITSVLPSLLHNSSSGEILEFIRSSTSDLKSSLS
jgi:hypothetical protein